MCFYMFPSIPRYAAPQTGNEIRKRKREGEIKREGLQRKKKLPFKMKTPFKAGKAERSRFTDGWGPRLEDGD